MERIEVQDLVGVRSRVSWSAIFGGAAAALATYLLWSTLGVAIGLSVSDSVGDRELGMGAATWAVVTLLFSLFVGGAVASRLTVGEDPGEATLYGMLVWCTMMVLLLGLMGSGVQMGFNAMMGVATAPTNSFIAERLTPEEMQRMGMTEEQIQNMQARAGNVPFELRERARDPRTQSAAWWTFGGLLVSMLAAVGGAWVGAGPYMHFLQFGPQHRTLIAQRHETQEVVRR